MQYVVSTIWKHPAEMDKDSMREVQAQWRENDKLVNIYWFEIDSTTHGSVSIFTSKDAFEANLAMQQAHRKTSTDDHQITRRMRPRESVSQCFMVKRPCRGCMNTAGIMYDPENRGRTS